VIDFSGNNSDSSQLIILTGNYWLFPDCIWDLNLIKFNDVRESN